MWARERSIRPSCLKRLWGLSRLRAVISRVSKLRRRIPLFCSRVKRATGTELIARAIHKDVGVVGAFVSVNCVQFLLP